MVEEVRPKCKKRMPPHPQHIFLHSVYDINSLRPRDRLREEPCERRFAQTFQSKNSAKPVIFLFFFAIVRSQFDGFPVRRLPVSKHILDYACMGKSTFKLVLYYVLTRHRGETWWGRLWIMRRMQTWELRWDIRLTRRSLYRKEVQKGVATSSVARNKGKLPEKIESNQRNWEACTRTSEEDVISSRTENVDFSWLLSHFPKSIYRTHVVWINQLNQSFYFVLAGLIRIADAWAKGTVDLIVIEINR
jgi:hypothetical protein